MAPPTLENCEETLRKLITLRKQEGYYRQTLQELRSDQAFLDQLWNYANRVDDLFEHYKVVVRDYQIAAHNMSHRENTATQFDEVMDFYESAFVYIKPSNTTKRPKANHRKPNPQNQ